MPPLPHGLGHATRPLIPGDIPSDTMAMAIEVQQPDGVELVQWLPTAAALDQPIGKMLRGSS